MLTSCLCVHAVRVHGMCMDTPNCFRSIHTCMYVCMYIKIYVHNMYTYATSASMYIHIDTSISRYGGMNTHTHTNIHTPTHKYVHSNICEPSTFNTITQLHNRAASQHAQVCAYMYTTLTLITPHYNRMAAAI
jgi:hypothetical protein